jgi:hypothetical protein
MVIMLLVIIVVFLFWSFGVNNAQAQLSSRTILYMHCKEWQDAQCEPTAAESIMINIEGESELVSFDKLCAMEYDKVNKPPRWMPDGYEGCRKLCMGCPKIV